MSSQKKIAAFVAAAGIAGVVASWQCCGLSNTLLIKGADFEYESTLMNNTLRINYQDGTTEEYVDLLKDSTVDMITITDPGGVQAFYTRTDYAQQPIVQLGQMVFDKYTAEIRKRKKN